MIASGGVSSLADLEGPWPAGARRSGEGAIVGKALYAGAFTLRRRSGRWWYDAPVFTGTEWEPVVGYSRAVAAGDYVFVAGCTSVVGAEFVHEDDAYAQTAQALRNVAAALDQLGLGLPDAGSTRILVTYISRWQGTPGAP